MNVLRKKTAVVTGGGTGIGLAIAEALASRGAQVVICGRRESVLTQAARLFEGEPPLRHHAVDVRSRESVMELFRWVADHLKHVDILVNSAGVNIAHRSMADMRPEQWDQVMAINATGVYNCMHAVLPQMRKRGSGLIINISSISGKRAAPLGGVAYNASKFACAALSTSVANEDAPHGIRVTTVFPGEVNTPILDDRPERVSKEHRAAILQPDDVGEVVAAIAALPEHVHIPELVIKPTKQQYI